MLKEYSQNKKTREWEILPYIEYFRNYQKSFLNT